MAAILRVKRKTFEAPEDALVISCKRQKTSDEAEDDSVSAVVKFAATVPNQDEDAVKVVTKKLKTQLSEQLKNNFKKPPPLDPTSKQRLDHKQRSADSRYKVVNCLRGVKTDDDGSTQGTTTLIDIETSESNSGECDFVYDLYYMDSMIEIDENKDSLVVESMEQELFNDDYETAYDLNEDSDSNSESHWKNDYPDDPESENYSTDDEEIVNAVQTMKLDGEDSDLSSEEEYAYAMDEQTVEKYGHRYAKFEAKMNKILGVKNETSDESFEDSEEEKDEDEDEDD